MHNELDESEYPLRLTKEDMKFIFNENKPFYIDTVRALIKLYDKQEISLSKLVEDLNVTVFRWQQSSAAEKKGCRWVKASIRLPTEYGWYVCKYCHPNAPEYVGKAVHEFKDGQFYFESDEAANLEWLDETTPDNDKYEEAFILHLIDVTWNEAFEDESVPATDWAKRIIEKPKESYLKRDIGIK
jgi:hypothetical protein